MANHMARVAELLGLNLGDEFVFSTRDGYITKGKITKNGTKEYIRGAWSYCDKLLREMITGDVYFEKKKQV